MLRKMTLAAAAVLAVFAVAAPNAPAQTGKSASNAAVCTVLVQTDNGLRNIEGFIEDLPTLAAGVGVTREVARVRKGLAPLRAASCSR
jgi:hypothetical protein